MKIKYLVLLLGLLTSCNSTNSKLDGRTWKYNYGNHYTADFLYDLSVKNDTLFDSKRAIGRFVKIESRFYENFYRIEFESFNKKEKAFYIEI